MMRRFIKWEDPFAKMVVSGLIGGAGCAADLLTCGKRHDRMGIRFVSDILVGDDAQRSTQTDIGNFSGVVGATAATVAADVELKSFNSKRYINYRFW